MKLYLPLLVIALLTAAVSAALYLAEQKTVLGAWPPRRRQLLYGAVFGLLSVCGTEFGATVGGITLNESAAAPLCAGLIFGAPAGLLAGVIGGVERYFATLWGAGVYGRYAGSITILFAGVLGAAMRRYLFEGKRPPWYYGLAAGILAEVADMLLLLLTRLTEIRQAFVTVELGMLPLTLMNGLAVMLALLWVSRLDGAAPRAAQSTEGLARIFQRWLLVCVTLAFAVTGAFTWWIEDDISQSQIENTLRLNLADVSEAMLDNSGADLLPQDIAARAAAATLHRHVGENGFLVVCDENWRIVSDTSGHAGQNLRDLDATGYRLDAQTIAEDTVFTAVIYGTPSRCMYRRAAGYIILAVLPEAEASFARSVSVSILVIIEAIIFTALFVQIYVLVRRRIVGNVRTVNRSLARIAAGDLSEKVDVRASAEFAALSDDINATVEVLKRYIGEAASRIDRELAIARSIQASALPSVFPPYPERTEFDIWALMRPAKEVAGDFYDFWLQGNDRLLFLVADVSGKGIPAAMFMMRAKTLLNSLAETGLPVDRVLTQANRELCENNQAGLFVTVWMGALDLESGQVVFGNAGHNPPLLRRADGAWEYQRSHPNLVLAGMEDIQYKTDTLRLEPGDTLYLYTDGVTEAADPAQQLYGEDRLKACLDGLAGPKPEALCKAVLADVDRFAGQAPQFDDITMLCLRYRGHGRRLKVPASIDRLPEVLAFVGDCLDGAGCPAQIRSQIEMAADEIFSNIAQYAYGGRPGSAAVQVEINEHTPAAILTFTDKGKPFNPLEREDPDVTLPAAEREPGGLGIYLVKKTMDKMDYEYRRGSNRLRIVKAWPAKPTA